MHFLVSSEIFAAHPDARIGIIVLRGIDNSKNDPEIATMLRKAEGAVRDAWTVDTFKEHPNIAAMQEVHRAFGNNPNKYPPSIQALLKRVLKGGQLPSINSLVDLYNVISLRYVVCIGAEDTDVCEGDITLTKAGGGEAFTPLGETENDPPEPGEYVYRDVAGVICRKLNWREGDRTKITENTKNAVVVIEGFPPVTQEALQRMLEELGALIRQYCGGETRVEILSKERGECSIE